jgi:hypothetical protein
MMDVRLLQSQKNDVLDAILNAGLDPAEFTWSDEREPMQNLCSRITHKPSGFSAGFTVDQMAYTTMLVGQFSPGEHFRFERYDASDWQMLLVHTINWALRLANELRQPDRWSIYTDAQALMDAAGGTTGRDGSFSRSERAEIEKQIKAVKAQVAALPGRTEQQIADANAKLDYLVEASKKQGRQDWYFTAVGVIATIATSLNVTPAEARMLFQLVGQGLRAIGI